MLFFPNAKINVGLDILRRREDGFHDIETLMVPVRGLCDVLEITPAEKTEFILSGAQLDCAAEDNLCMRAHKLIGAPPARIHLHKVIPFGAGLGGGSADAAFTLKGLNKVFSLGRDDLEELAAELGSDVPFFIRNTAQIASGRGEILSPAENPFEGKWVVIVKPDIYISTREAYSSVRPEVPEKPLRKNAFEGPLMEKYPVLGRIKEALVAGGAEYASLSGSGSAMYGIFEREPVAFCFSEKNCVTLRFLLT